MCLLKTLSAYWKLPVLIFQSCDDYSGYVCTDSILGDEQELQILNADCLRKIVPLHICEVIFTHLVVSEYDSEIVADNSFTSTLENIGTFMKNASVNEDNEVLQGIVDQNETFDNLMNKSEVGSSTTSELTSEGFLREEKMMKLMIKYLGMMRTSMMRGMQLMQTPRSQIIPLLRIISSAFPIMISCRIMQKEAILLGGTKIIKLYFNTLR